MRNLKHILVGAVLATVFAAQSAVASTTLVGPIQTYTCAAHSWAQSLAGGTALTTCTQPAFSDITGSVTAAQMLALANGNVYVGNGSNQPVASATPTLGVAGTTAGSLGLAGATSGVFTQGAAASTTSYTLTWPAAAPAASGQALTATTAGVASWATIPTAAFTVSTNPASPVTLAAAADGTRYQTSSAAVTFNLTGSLVAGDNWCFTQTAGNAVTIADNSVTNMTITMGTTVGTATTGTLISAGAGSTACLYMSTATSAIVWSSEGQWTLS